MSISSSSTISSDIMKSIYSSNRGGVGGGGGGQTNSSLNSLIEKPSAYVKLNVGGNLFYTTVGTLISRSLWFNSMFSGQQEVKSDDDGWILIDRSGKHFETILNYLRDGEVPLPENRQDLIELHKEAKFYAIDNLRQLIEIELDLLKKQEEEDSPFSPNHLSSIVIVKCPQLESKLLLNVKKPIVKLKMNRSNNVFSYTTNSHDILLRHIECLEKYALMFMDTVLFIRDVRNEKNEVCEWSFYYRGYLLKKIDCSSIHYSTDARLTKVEFPESKIHEEMLCLISLATRNITDKDLLDIYRRKQNTNMGGGGNGSSSANGPINHLLNTPYYPDPNTSIDSTQEDVGSAEAPEADQIAHHFHIPGTTSHPNLHGVANANLSQSSNMASGSGGIAGGGGGNTNGSNNATAGPLTSSSSTTNHHHQSNSKRLFSSLRFRSN